MVMFYLNLFFAFTNLMYFVQLRMPANLIVGLLNLFVCVFILLKGESK